MKKNLITAVACVASLVVTPAYASCWTPSQVAAAKVRDLDTMLMVSALRCRKTNVEMMDRYNAFVVQDRIPLTKVNDVLREHFIEKVGHSEALNAYDNYVTKVANRYGAGSEGLSCEDMSSIVGAAASEQVTVEALIQVAERANISPILDEQACPITIASIAP
jgi:hypothetical protein